MKKFFTFLICAIFVGHVVAQNYFTVNDNKRVIFSSGNLQYNAKQGTHECVDGTIQQGTWRFAEHQYDLIGDDNNNASENYDGWIDMFSWGTSGYDGKNPWGTDPAFPNQNANISDTYYDWGVYNQISNNDNSWNWRTLSSAEFIVLMQRDNSGKGGRAYVDGRQSLIFLPDNTDGYWTSEGSYPKKWTLNADKSITFVSASGWNGDRYWNTSIADSINIYSIEQWNLMEEAGAILLPYTNTATNWSDVFADGTNTGRRYWTSTTRAFSTADANDDGGNAVCLQHVQVRVYGEGVHSKSTKAFVRLVKDCQYKISPKSENTTYGSVQIDGGEDGWFEVSSTATITAIPKDGYFFTQWNDGNTDNPRTIKVTSPTTFTALFSQIKTSEIPDITVDYGQEISLINLSSYFKVNSSINYSFEAQSSNDNVVCPVVMGKNLGFIQYGTGTAKIDVSVSIGSTTVIKSFLVTINSVSVEEPCNLSVTPNIKNVTCHGLADGKIETEVTGGTEPYQYHWNTGRSSSGIYNVPQGYYSILVTDVLGCSVSDTFYIEEPSKIIVSESIVNPTCDGTDGSLMVNVTGGSGQYYICYNFDETTHSFAEKTENNVLSMTGLSAGTYIIAVQDKQNTEMCVDTLVFSLSEKDAPTIELLKLKSSKCNEATGLIEVAYYGGKKPYTIVWKDGEKTAKVPNITKRTVLPGIYTLYVTDANNCKAMKTLNVGTIPFKQPEVSLVSYGKESKHNLIVWKKEQTNEIDKYLIYRETEQNGEYEQIGSQNYNEISVFVDETTNPRTNPNPYRYRISAANKCLESQLSHESKTINLQWKRDENNAIHLWWDAYEGIEYVKFTVYRLTRGGQFMVSEVPANKFRYIAENPEPETMGYFVAVDLIEKIDVTQLMKSESGPFIIAVSNIAELENFVDAIDDIPENQAIVYAKGKNIVVNSTEQANVVVFDIAGQLVAQQNAVQSATIPVKTAGVYVVIVGDKTYKVVVQ